MSQHPTSSSRRGVLRSLSALPLIGGAAAALAAPAASGLLDPALPGIARTRAILNRALAIEAATTDNLPPEWSVLVGEGVAALTRIPAPTTLAGAQALARLAVDLRPGLGLDLEEELPGILERIAGRQTSALAPVTGYAEGGAPAVSGVGAACIAQVERMGAMDRIGADHRALTDEESDAEVDAEVDRWGAVTRRAIAEPSTGLPDLVAKARLMLGNLDRIYPEEMYDDEEHRLMRVILREAIAMGGQV